MKGISRQALLCNVIHELFHTKSVRGYKTLVPSARTNIILLETIHSSEVYTLYHTDSTTTSILLSMQPTLLLLYYITTTTLTTTTTTTV